MPTISLTDFPTCVISYTIGNTIYFWLQITLSVPFIGVQVDGISLSMHTIAWGISTTATLLYIITIVVDTEEFIIIQDSMLADAQYGTEVLEDDSL